ncbi:hypothetical protein K1719_045273 [Acacia pycnantha]|nr:hypothetical protein K1719_045273 [Acacia pycnantha]
MFSPAGSRTSFVARYDIGKDEWVAMEGLPSFRAGCVGFLVGNGLEDRREFWVMGGYGASMWMSHAQECGGDVIEEWKWRGT